MNNLLELLKNELFITWDDEETNKRLTRIIQNAKETMNLKLGARIDYTKSSMAQNLFLTYCAYVYNGCVNDFEENYLNDILQLRSYYSINGIEEDDDGEGEEYYPPTDIDLSAYALKEDIPTKLSQLTNDQEFVAKDYVDEAIANAKLNGGNGNVNLDEYVTESELNQKGFLTNIPSEYITEEELNKKGYLTEHQDISHLAEKNELFSKDYNELINKPTIPSLNGYATETYVNTQIANAQLGGGETDIDLSGYATKDDLNSKADKTSIPTKASQLENDNNYLTTIPSEYITETELNQKGYLTSHQDISHLAAKSELHSHSNKSVLDNITSTQINNWNNKSEFSGNYNDLINKPTIPSKTSQLTNDSNFLTSVPSEYITETELSQKGYLTEHQDISHLAEKDDLHSHNNKTVLDGITSYKVSSWDNKSNFSGSYNDLTNKPTIPSIAGLASEDYVDDAITQAKLSGTVDLTGYATKEELNAKADADDIPTKTSQLTNDSGYLTAIPSEYITETELNQKGYLTSVPSEYITETELNNSLSSYALKSEQLATKTISNSRLTLTTDKRQVASMANNTTITLPSVSSFTEIHLYFTTSSNYTITFPSVKWQETPSITSGKSYEFIFTYVNSSIGWLGGFIEYGN